jgi:pimeloyl-ACP methyl ester carboxylesterase
MDALLDDRQLTISSAADVANRRAALIQFIWGSDGFPNSRLPSSIERNVPSPVSNLGNLERVDTLHIAMDAGLEGLAHHFIAGQKNGRLVVFHHGHACSFDDNPGLADRDVGMQRTINGLLSYGYSVLAVYMPHMRPGDCRTISHGDMFDIPTTGSPMKFFLESVAVSLNYLKTKSALDGFPAYQDFSMVGLSGGGWTTTVYAAIDPTIKLSFPVAGSIQLYLRSGDSIGDEEQWLSRFYQVAGYPDLYILGSHGLGRKQIQILNRRDDCCFGESQHDPTRTGMTYDEAMRGYESRVQSALHNLGSGFFHLEIDEVAPYHMISQNALVNVILPELNGGR